MRSTLECGGSHRLPPSVHTAKVQGAEEGRSLLSPFGHPEAIVCLPRDPEKAVPVASLAFTCFPYWARAKGGGCCDRTPSKKGVS